MDELIKMILTASATSGIIGIIITLIITNKVKQEFDRLDRREKLRDENQLLMMKRIDSSADITHMMATKLHDAGIINGGLKELDDKYKELNTEYSDNLRRLAREVLNK